MDKNKIEILKEKIKDTHQKFDSAYDSLDELNNMFVYKGFKLENDCLVVLGAMDGYGNPIKIEE